MKCINKSHPEYISLLENNPYPVPLLDAKISIWQDQNNTDEFPTLEQLAQPVDDSKVQDYSNTIIKQGVDDLFKENKELSKIGSRQLYSKYLDSVFPDSKVKDIVYHYTDAKKFDKFVKDYIGSSVERTRVNAADSELGIFFGKKGLEGVVNKEKLGTTEIPALINIKNPNNDIYDKADEYLYSSERFIDEQEPDYDIEIEEDENGNIKNVYKEKDKLKGKDLERAWYNSYKKDLIAQGKDGVVLDNIKIVFEPEQIHILGSKQDIQGFKEFVNSNNVNISLLPDSISNIKPGVSRLFESNPELANNVYEALGFKTESSSNTITRDIKEELPFKVIGNYNEIDEGLIGRKFYEEKIGNDLYRFEISNYSYPNEDGSSESFYDIDFTVNGSEEVIGTGFFDKAERAKQILQALLSQNFGNDTVRFNVEESKKGKQRLSLYKRLMNQLGYNPSGEMEYALFYNTNTFLSPSDKIIFGHPTIGKSFLKNQGEDKFITLDDDYANEVNSFIDANKGSETRQEYKGRKPKEYNDFMLNLYDKLKIQAKKEGKILFVSNTNILKERMSDFDKVITMPKDEFKKRFDARGATYGFEDWKSDIDATVAKVPTNKIINTTGYLSDLFKPSNEIGKINLTPQQKQQAQQLYSQYLNTIFPDSQIKDIVYHGSNEKIEKFDKSKSEVSDVIYFSNDVREAIYYSKKQKDGKRQFIVDEFKYINFTGSDGNVFYIKKSIKETEEKFKNVDELKKYSISKKEFDNAKNKFGNLNPSVLNIKKLYNGVGEDLFFGVDEKLKKQGFDGFITNNDEGIDSILAVFEPEQIHILGSKQDIEGFKGFVKESSKPKVPQITDEYGNTWNEVTLPKFQQTQVSVPALNLNYPVNQDQFKNNLNYANISQEHKDGLELLVDANVPIVYLKTTLDDVEQTFAELQKIMPSQYIELLPAVTIEDITFQEIAVKNPGIDLLKEEERVPVTSDLLTDAEIFETFSTFFSEGGVRSTRQDPKLDNMMINLLKSYGVDIVKGNDVNVEIDRMITQGIIGEEYRHKVWAFVHLMANGPSKAKVFLKPDGYVTKDLYEEAGHIFMSWLSDSTFNIQGIEFKPWEIPSSGTDYLSLTAYYKARHNEIRNHYLMRINNEIAKIYELINEKATATPERLDELDTLIDTPSNRKLKLLNEFQKKALADRLMRIEISGKILGEALEARAEGKAYSTKASNKGIIAFFTRWANALVDFIYWVKSKFSGKEINTLRAALNSKSWLTDVGADAAQIEDYANQMEDLAEQIFGNNTKITPSKDLNFFETIASDHISEIDKLVNSIPEDLRQQQEVIENSIHELLANKFLERYSDYLQDLNDEALTQGIPPNLYIALRRLTPEGSAKLKGAIDSFKLLSPQDKMLHAEKGVFHILKDALNKQTQFGNKDMGEIYKIFIEEGLKQVIVNNVDPALLPTELGNFVKDFNTKLDNILIANIADGQIIPSLNTSKYNFTHGEFIEYQRRLKLLDENMAKINLIDAYIGNHKIKEALQLFLFGKTVIKNQGSVYEEKINIPPLFKELDNINAQVQFSKDRINDQLKRAEASGQLQQAALRNWENAGKVPNTPEALAYQAASAKYENDRALVQYTRPSTKQYELLYIKFKYFNEIFKTLSEENNGTLKILSYFPVNKKLEVKQILEDSAKQLASMDAYFKENDQHFMSEIGKALNTIQKDPANPDNDQKYALDSLVSDSTVAKDIGSLEKLMGAKMNHDPYWAHIVAHFYRLNKLAAIKTHDAFEFVKNSFEKNYEAIRKNKAIAEIRKKTHTGSIQELFHEREDGKRTHFMLSPYLHGKLEREQQEYLQEIYTVLNKELEKRGSPIRIPNGNLPYDEEQRKELLRENADPELTDDPDLREIREMWQHFNLGYKINFNQPKSQQEIDRIIAEKEATLDPFALDQWKRTSMKKYYTVNKYGKSKAHILYLGELAVPSHRLSQEIINLAIPTETDEVESFPIRLNKTDYINPEFNTLYSDPSFAELYDQMHKMQMEIYSLHQGKATWNRVNAYRTGAFAGGALDIGKRGFSLNLKLAVNKIGDLINDIVNISSENEFRIDPKKPQLPMHGVIPFINSDGTYDANKLSDNYFDIISKYYHSMTQYDVKKKGLPQLEILKDLLKRRIVDAEVKRVKKIGQYGNDTLTLEETLEEKAIKERWSQFIDDAYENHVYEQHTKVNVGDTWRAKAYYITKMSALTTWWYLSGNTSSAIAARGQATKELFDMAINKRLMTSKGGILNAMMSIIKLYHKDRLNTVGEYFGNTILSKNTAIDSYLGLSNEHKPSIKYSNGLYKLLGDITGLGVLKYANSRPRRIATERLLRNYKWIAEEGMFMNPSMYHRYLESKSDVKLNYQDSIDKFELLGNSAYDMLEFKNGKIEATDPNIMNQERRAQLGVYLTEVHDKIDMADSDPSEFSRGIVGKMFLPLKKWLAKWAKMLFQNKFNAITGTEEKAYFQTIMLWALGWASKKRRDEIKSRASFYDDVREAWYKIISTAVVDATLAQLTIIAAQNAMGDCEGEKIDTWRCWWAAMAASTVARVKAEQGLYSITNMLTNFDKPIASNQGSQKILDNVSTVLGLPFEAITSNLIGEDEDKPIQAGPYKDKTRGQKALISILPFIRNPYEFFSPKGQVVRQQLITDQLNKDWVPFISIPGTWNSIIQGPVLNKGYKFLYPNTPWKDTYPKVITTEQD